MIVMFTIAALIILCFATMYQVDKVLVKQRTNKYLEKMRVYNKYHKINKRTIDK